MHGGAPTTAAPFSAVTFEGPKSGARFMKGGPASFVDAKKDVPKVLNRPGSRGQDLLSQTQKHYQDTKGVYKTTDAHGNIVYYAHKGSL